MLTENKFGKYLLYAIGEIALVMIGILLALQVSNWNEQRKDKKEQHFLLTKMRSDIESDKERIAKRIELSNSSIENYIECLDILASDKEVSRAEFMTLFGNILATNQFTQTTTTFDNLVSTGKIELIQNEALLDAIVGYYNKEYKEWDGAMKHYTRNIIAPYIMSTDHIPNMQGTKGLDYSKYGFGEFYAEDVHRFKMAPKTVEDYREDQFIINALRVKTFNYQGQLTLFIEMQDEMENLTKMIEKETNRLSQE